MTSGSGVINRGYTARIHPGKWRNSDIPRVGLGQQVNYSKVSSAIPKLSWVGVKLTVLSKTFDARVTMVTGV